MNLHSLFFLLCFAVLWLVLFGLQLLEKRNRFCGTVQLCLLLLFSLYFLYRFDWRFCVCILAVTVIAYLDGILIARTKRRLFLVFGVAVLLGFLAYYKYSEFFVNSIRDLAGLDHVALHILLPLGISFYVFSAVAYLIDVSRNEYDAETNILYFALYISFFPKLTAGPIVRGKDFFPQVRNYRGVRRDVFRVGIQIFAFGLFKKIVLADHLGVFVDDVFRAPTAFNTGTVILAAISYSLQIYFDFSGYSDMAIGVSKLLGFDFKPNFNLPYLAENASDFWERWHISLSSWFRDYLYFPLGGNRKGKVRTYLNLFIVMLVSGLWHGAGWTFVIWGALHGAFGCLSKALGNQLQKCGSVFCTLMTFCVVTLLWVVFRADSLSTAFTVWARMFTAHSGISQPYTWSFFALACLAVGTTAAWKKSKKTVVTDQDGDLFINGYYPILDLSRFWHMVAFFTFVGITVILGYYGNTAFIYGMF